MNDSLADTITPKSDQLNADDLLTSPMTVTIKSVSRGSPDQPIICELVEFDRPYKPCKSMRRVMIATWGDKGSDWVGQRVTLYNDPSVKFGGVEVGGIRISHISGIEQPTKFNLTTTRGKRGAYHVEPIQIAAYPSEEFAANFPKWKKVVKEGKYTIDQIIQGCSKKGALTSEQVEKIKALANE